MVFESLIHVYELLALHSSGKGGECRSDKSRRNTYLMGQHKHKEAMYILMNEIVKLMQISGKAMVPR